MTLCNALTQVGQPCKRHAVRGSQPPRCFAHGGRRPVPDGAPVDGKRDRVSFYQGVYTAEEIAGLLARSMDPSLEDEIDAVRVAIRRLMQRSLDELDAVEYRRLVSVLFSGANTIARLLRTQRVLVGESADGIAGAIAQTLDEVSAEWGIDL